MLTLTLPAALALAVFGVPLGLALLGGVILGVVVTQPEQFTQLPTLAFNSVNDPNLVAIPLLIVAGQLMATGKLLEPIMVLLDNVLGRMRGGLALTCVATAVFFGGSSGSSAGEAATLANVFQGPLENRGYHRGFTAALCAAAGSLGPLFPPSLGLVIFGTIVQYPVTNLWKAAIVPGVIGAVLMAGVGVFVGARTEQRDATKPVERERVSVARTIGAVLVPVIVVGGVFGGFLTLADTAAVLVTYVFLYALVLRTASPRELLRGLARGGEQAGMIVLLFIGAHLLSFFVISGNGEQAVIEDVLSWHLGRWELLLVMNLALLALGMLIDGLSLLVLATPLLFPIMQQIGVTPVQFGIMLIFNIEVAVVHPPIGMNLFAVSGVTGVPVGSIARRIIPFIVVILAVLALVTFAPLPIFEWV